MSSTVFALWPDNTMSVVVMESGWTPVDLFYELDHIGNPVSAKVWVLKKRPGGCVHATTDWVRARSTETAADLAFAADAATNPVHLGPHVRGLRVSRVSDDGAIRRFHWPPGIERKFLYASWRDAACQESLREVALNAECGKMLSELPSPPPPSHTAKEVNQMAPFSGVYIAWNCDGTAHYVGESINVPSRVQSSRTEIGDRMIGVLSCDRTERLRIEALFIGLLNPAGNHQSPGRVAVRDSRREHNQRASSTRSQGMEGVRDD